MVRKLIAIATITLGMAAVGRGETYYIEAGYPQDTGSTITGHAAGEFHVASGVITDSLDTPTGYTFDLNLFGNADYSLDPTDDSIGSGSLSGNYTVYDSVGTIFSTGAAAATGSISELNIPNLFDLLTRVELDDLTFTSSSNEVVGVIDAKSLSIDSAVAGLDGGLFFSGGPLTPAVAPVPLPKSAETGFVLIGGMGVVTAIRRRRAAIARV